MTIQVPATSANLGPGFDSLGLALSLYNTFSISHARVSSVSITGEGQERIRLRIDNAFVRIFNEILSMHNYPPSAFKFSFHNDIPISRGLGSSSAVIIGAIVGAYNILQKPIVNDEILRLALKYEKHPDNITPALLGGFNIAMLESIESSEIEAKSASLNSTDSSLDSTQNALNEATKKPKKPPTQTITKVISFKATLPESIRAIVLVPHATISTKLSRRSLPKVYSTKDAVFNLSHACMLSAAFIAQDWELLRVASKDRFHQDSRMKHLPMLFEVQRLALKHGALLSTLSGSGSSFLNICYADESAKLKQILQSAFPKCRVFNLAFDNIGTSLLES